MHCMYRYVYDAVRMYIFVPDIISGENTAKYIQTCFCVFSCVCMQGKTGNCIAVKVVLYNSNEVFNPTYCRIVLRNC